LIDGIIFSQQHPQVFYFWRWRIQLAEISGGDGDGNVAQLFGQEWRGMGRRLLLG